MPANGDRPLPPPGLPPGRVVPVADRGEMFVRDSGGNGPPVLLLHGWMVSADVNWAPVYEPLVQAGYRVLAVDHRGHGRGPRMAEPFRLADCADDAGALLAELGCEPVVAVGYSMGGPIAQLLARRHRERVRALICCATALEWRDPYLRAYWRTMGALRLGLGLFPVGAWRVGMRLAGAPRTGRSTWVAAELSRGSSIDIAEAGRELSRHDARPWIAELRDLPSAVVVTTRDRSVLPRKQRALAQALGAPSFGVRSDHLGIAARPERFWEALQAALRSVERPEPGVRTRNFTLE